MKRFERANKTTAPLITECDVDRRESCLRGVKRLVS